MGSEEIALHIENGLQVAKLAVHWKGTIECVLDDQFAIKRIRYDDELLDKADDYNAETRAEQFDIEFSIMTLELSAFINSLCKAFGGIDENHQ